MKIDSNTQVKVLIDSFRDQQPQERKVFDIQE